MIIGTLNDLRKRREDLLKLQSYVAKQIDFHERGLGHNALIALKNHTPKEKIDELLKEQNTLIDSLKVVYDSVSLILEEKAEVFYSTLTNLDDIDFDVYQDAVANVIISIKGKLENARETDVGAFGSRLTVLSEIQMLRRRICTSYLSNVGKLPKDMTKMLIVRLLPNSYNPEKHKELIHTPALSPTKQLLLTYKEDGDWGYYVKKFTHDMIHRDDMVKALDDLKKRLLEGENICLICYEKDALQCHRSLLAEWFVEQGFEWKEI